jgi:hypothetical protein
MRTPLTTLAVALATTLTTALATTAVAGTTTGTPGQAASVTLGPVEVVDSYTAPYADSWYSPSAALADPAGVVTATWSDRGVQIAQRATDGTWGPPTRLFSCTLEQSCDYGAARLTSDSNGTVTAVFVATLPTQAVYASSHSPGGTWTTPVPISVGDQRAGGAIDIATAGNGATLVAYTAYVHGKGWVVVTRYRGPGSTWAQAHKRVFAHAAAPVVGMAANGVAMMGVTRSSSPSALRTYRFRPGHGWSRPVVQGVTFESGWDLATDATGRTVVSWDSAPDHPAALVARVMNRHGHWGARHVLTRKAVSTIPYVAVHRAATVLWSTNRGAIKSATRTPGHPWVVTTAYPRHTGGLRDLATNARGDLALSWDGWVDPMPQLFTGIRPAGGSWTSPAQFPARYVGENVSAMGVDAVLPDGSAVVVTADTDADIATWPNGPATLRILARQISSTP